MSEKPKSRRHRLAVNGVIVSVTLDEKGNVRSAGATLRGDSPEDEARVAAAVALGSRAVADRAHREQYQEGQRKALEKRKEKAAEHWSAAWLELAHKDNPTFKGKRLARAARSLAAKGTKNLAMVDDAKMRAKITEYRAEAFLKANTAAK